MRFADVARPYRSGQTIVAVVGARNNFFGIGERHRYYHRPEDFFLHDLHAFLRLHQHRGFDEVSAVRALVATGHGLRALGETGFQISAHAIQLFL